MFWRRIMEGILNFVVGVEILVTLFIAIAVGSEMENFFAFLIVMVIGVMITLTSAAFMGMIIEGVKSLEEISSTLKAIERNSKMEQVQSAYISTPTTAQTTTAVASAEALVKPVVPAPQVATKTWICKSCSGRNSSNTLTCKMCGEFK